MLLPDIDRKSFFLCIDLEVDCTFKTNKKYYIRVYFKIMNLLIII